MKPTSIIIKEAKDLIVKSINESNVPACILELILKDLLNEIERINEKDLAEDIKKYNEELKKGEGNGKN